MGGTPKSSQVLSTIFSYKYSVKAEIRKSIFQMENLEMKFTQLSLHFQEIYYTFLPNLFFMDVHTGIYKNNENIFLWIQQNVETEYLENLISLLK